MKKTLFCLYLLLWIFLINNVKATTYYFSNSGSDNNNGLSPELAWKTIAKLNSMMSKIVPNDIILFERGNVFIGQINIYASGDELNPITFGAYGEGAKPIISGSIPIKNWSVFKENIYQTKVETSINNLFVNGEQMILARYPNSGLLIIKEPHLNPKTGFVDGDMKQTDGYWNGSNVRIRTENWAYEYSPVKNFVKGSFSFMYPTLYPVLKEFGYYLDNNLSELDTAKEWYFQKNEDSKGTLYFYPSKEEDINTSVIEGSIYNFGFYSQSEMNNIIIQDLEIKNQSVTGIWFTGNKSRIRIENCTFYGQIQSGLNFLGNTANCKINNSRFYNINGKGLYLLKSTNTIISNNIFKGIGMIPGYGAMKDPFISSAIIIMSSDSNHIFGNHINEIGHDGIGNTGSGNVIEKNVISNVLLLLNDGGAIKCYGLNSKNSIWRNNFIFNVPGNLNGTNRELYLIHSNGIYLDALSNNMKILNNTISGCGLSGIFLYDGCKYNLFNGNVCYGNQIGIYYHKETEAMVGNSTLNNIFFGVNSNQVSIQLKAKSEGFDPGKFDSNYYCNSFNIDMFQYQSGNNNIAYNFAGWKKLSGNTSDLNSKIIHRSETPYSKLFTNMTDDSTRIILDPKYLYKDLNLNSVKGSIVIEPWSSKILLMNSDINNLPEINVAGGPLYFGIMNKESSSSPLWYNLIGKNLNSPVTITAPNGFVISLEDDVNFSKTSSINPFNGKVDKIIFVKFKPNEEKSFYDFITITSGDLKSVVKVIGSSR